MRFGPKCPRGFLPVFSVDTVEEAESLIVLTCPISADGEYYSPELYAQRIANMKRTHSAQQIDDDLNVLNRFSERLAKAYELMQQRRKKSAVSGAKP